MTRLNKKQIVGLFFFFLIIFTLPIALFLAKQRQEIRKKAQETRQELLLFLDPQSNNQNSPWPAESEQTIKIKINNTSDKNLRFRVVGLDLGFDPLVLEIQTSSLGCNSPFELAGGNASKVEDGHLSLVCYLPPAGSQPSDPLSISPGQQMDVGFFRIKVKANIGSTTTINFIRSNIPEEDTLEDLSKFGPPGTYYIGTQVTGTPTPTLTPTPTSTSTPTPTPAPPTGECPDGENGNLNCDAQGLINAGDLSILLTKWSPEGPVPTPNPGQRSADIVVDGAVNAGDLGKLLGHWKVE